MAFSIGQIGLDLVVNHNQFQTQMRGIESLAKKAGTTLAAAFGVKKLIDFGKSCLELGSDLAEVQNVVDVTFPNMSAQVDKFAKGAAQSFGLSETMAKQFTGTFGAMAKAFGFTEKQAYDMGSSLTQLAGDVASFYNLSQDEAYTKLKSVFTGETESLKDLGVVMTQTALDSYALANGFGKTTTQMTEAEKVALRYSFVQKQLSAAQGDFARTSDSWANQVRILTLQFDSLKATIGQGLINLFTPIIRVINTVIGKLTVLAEAFKGFTELITGQKSSSGSNGVAAVAGAAGDAEESLNGASDAASGLTDNTNKSAKAAQDAAKKMKSLMGFDKVNKLNEPTTSTSGTTGTTTSPTGSVGTFDFGSLAEGETVIDKTDKKVSALVKKCKQLAAIFKKGFKIGFGDSEKKIQSINKSLESVGKNLKDIFMDPEIVAAANRCADSIVLSLGEAAGSATRVGLTITNNLVGGIDKYLTKSSGYIKNRIVSMFDATGDIAALAGKFTVACAEIFDVFSGDDAKGITTDIIQVFSDGFLGVADLTVKFARDYGELFTEPIIQNTEKIITTVEGILGRWRLVLDALAQSVTDTFAKFNEIYDQYFKPFIDSIVQGISDILGTFLDAYNTYISPMLDYLAAKFGVVWEENVQPALDGCIELLGKIAENLQALWETLLVPLIEWIVENILPVISPIIGKIGDLFLDILKTVSDVIKGITEVLGGFLDFCTGAFTGDFSKCWQGIGEILEGFKTVASSVFEFAQKYILEPFGEFLKGTFISDWSQGFETMQTVLNTFFEAVQRIIEDVKGIFSGINEFISGAFAGDWDRAWQGIVDVFGNVFDGIVTLAKTPINAVIDLINGLMSQLNGLLEKIENAFSFNYDFKNPITGTRYYGHHGLTLPRVPTIPHLAKGGYVKANTPQLAMIGDNRHQGEVVSPEDKLQEMALKAAAMAGSGVTKEELESIINRAVLRIVAALADMGFYMDSTLVNTVLERTKAAADIRYNTVEVR